MEELLKIAEGTRVCDAYKGVKRDWMDNVDENAIDKVIGTHDFQVWVNLFVTEVTDEESHREAI